MARSRMIKIDFWHDEKLASISMQARLLYIGLWNLSDDYGVVKGNPNWIKNNMFPYDDLALIEFTIWLDELINLKRLAPFSANGERYLFIVNFKKHQKVDRPSKTIRNPAPPTEILSMGSRE